MKKKRNITRINRSIQALKGFTLVEMLVVMAIVAIVGLFLVVIFTNTLRGSNKSQAISVIKQNGQAVLENMDKTIRNAGNVICPSSPGNTIVVEQNGVYTRYRAALSNDGAGTAPADCLGTTKNGCIIQDIPVKDTDPVTGQPETDTAFISRICYPNSLMSGAKVLTDTNFQTGVQIVRNANDPPFFTVNKLPGYKTAVTVSFMLKPGAGASATFAGQIDPVTFQTTIQLR